MSDKTLKQKQQRQDKEKQAYAFYVAQGWTPEQSIGIIGNIKRESGFNPNAIGDAGKAFGLAQWHPDRQAKAKSLYGNNWKSFENQLKFIDWELKNTEKVAGDKLKKTKGVWQAGQVVSDFYERPKVKFSGDETRQTYVADLAMKFKGVKLTPEDMPYFDASYANSVAPYMNQPQETITPTLNYFNIPKEITTFASVPDSAEEDKKETVEDGVTSKDVAEVEQKTKEYNFLEELQKEDYSHLQPEQVAQQQTVPQVDFNQQYEQVSQFIDEPLVVQQGGGMVNFYKEYINSPNYKKRLITQGYTNPEQVKKDRLSNLNKITQSEVNDIGSQYYHRLNKVNIDNKELKKHNFNKETTTAHEYSHGVGAMNTGNSEFAKNLTLNTKETNLINSKNNYLDIDTSYKNKKLTEDQRASIEHNSVPSEAKADIDALRFKLKKAGLYDTGTQQFNQDILNKAKKMFSKDTMINRNFKAFDDKDLIWIMNNIAQNEEDTDDTTQVAQQGGSVKQDNEWLKNWYTNRVIPNKDVQGAYLEDKPIYTERLKNIPLVTKVNMIDNNPQKTGQYQGDTGKILMTPTAQPSVYTHEVNHYLNDFPSTMRTVHENVVEQNMYKKGDSRLGGNNEYYDYLRNPDEIHSRVQVLRKDAGFKPNEEVTQDKLLKYLQNYKGSDENILQLMNLTDEKGLLEMLNYMAETPKNKEKQYVAQQGLTWQEKLANRPKKPTVAEIIAEGDARKAQQRTQVDNTKVSNYNNARLFNPNVRNKTDKEIAQEREAKIQASVEAQKTPYTKENWRQQLAAETVATGDKLRVSLEPNFFDDYINPASMIGSMASNLGQAPLQAKQSDSVMPYVTAIGTPLVTGALAGIGAKTTGQFANNIVNPLAGTNNIFKVGIKQVKNQADIVKDLLFDKNTILNKNFIFDTKDKIYNQIEQGYSTLDSALEQKINDLQTFEGMQRLVNQEKEYLQDFYYDPKNVDLAKTATENAKARIEELENIKAFGNKNKEFVYNVDRNNVDKVGILKPHIETVQYAYDIPTNNAHYQYNNNIIDNPSGTKMIPGKLTLGRGYEDSTPTAFHEINHALQRGRTLKIDDELKNITPDFKKNLSYDDINAYTYFKSGSDGKESSSFLAELRSQMQKDGFIKNTYDEVSPDLIEKAKDYYSKNKNKKVFASRAGLEGITNTRILDFSRATPENYKIISDAMNKLPVIAPIAGASYLATQGQEEPKKLQQGGEFSENELAFLSEIAIKDNNGYWNKDNQGKVVEIDGNQITMKGVDQDLIGIGIDKKGKKTEQKTMKAGKNYNFDKAIKVIEIPLFKK